MSEGESGEDKTEDPTEKHKREAREQGQIPRSRDLNTFIVMMAGVCALLMFGGGIAGMMMAVMKHSLSVPREAIMDTNQMGIYALSAARDAVKATGPVLVIMLLAALIGPVSLGGWLFSAKSMAPKFSRMNPLSGLKRMFTINSAVELIKSLAKFGVTLAVALHVLQKDRNDLLAIAHEPLERAMLHSIQVIGWSAFYMTLGLLIIVAVDVPLQIYQGRKKLMMSKQEIKDEYKATEGKPEVKGRIRQMQREVAQRRMMANVPNADVVITNPTHFAVALKYDAEQGSAPVLLAKGTDMSALKIREIANEHRIQVMESPELARAIYYSTEADQQIPAGLYLAVAQVLAYVYQIRQYRAGQGKRPEPPKHVPVPDDLKRDEAGKPEGGE
ncbi:MULTISPECIES: flagellar biosynthesis protein FlhB [unclassified Pseudomonas]|uniref:flagellar biosynthesis protein FlhB n=1 Tax=unclassified Pseudomonas TaxID=196821 RepID=UPI000BDD042F|nr:MULTISPECIES: flagellar biosynthesis protein FlhB [unclassified Pseudomonas]PVZ20492.1 flagellar biosynthetic protein FlhB [Pseudomonas sp. URIL14HWK12:I12]PVZ27558.1 flagellar biosynthetic protein FlhB [Pseudomonas sp. URIL14HWK12:I10]PVZ38447.1 flagellar biosynthetic protein FlhB [Pseudomonas sp. URIL14HWK12:I11]SNZ03316.1 flagellar biosynthetic protein FlhB [Pseudomonas sp. URIL14HWK12:I9]